VEVLHVRLAGAVGLGRELAGLLLVDALHADGALQPTGEWPVEPHVERTGMVAEDDGRRTAEDDATFGVGHLAQDALGLVAERLLGLIAQRRPGGRRHRSE